MAFVLAATTTQTGITALSSFALLGGHNNFVSKTNLVPFVSGLANDYYITGDQYSANNALYLNNASSKLNDVLFVGIGLYSANNFNTTPGNYTGGPRYFNTALFPSLSYVSAEGNIYTTQLDFTSNPELRYCQMWAAGPLSSIKISGLKKIVNLDLRDAKLSAIDITGCIINSLNLCDTKLSAFEFGDGEVVDLSVSNNPFRSNYIDLNSCSTRFLTSIQVLQFSKWNQYSPNPYSSMLYPLSNINLRAPLSSIKILDLAQNNLSSVYVPKFDTLKYLKLGEYGLNRNGDTGAIPQTTLTATNITLSALTGLEMLYVGGIGPMSNNNQITGMDRLSSLSLLWISNNNKVGNVRFTDIDLSIIPSNRLGYPSTYYGVGGLYAANCAYLTGVDFGNKRFDSVNSFIDFTNCYALSTLNMSSVTGVNSVSFYNTYLSETRVTWPTPTVNINQFAIGGTNSRFTNIDTITIPMDLIIFNASNTAYLTSVNLDHCTRMLYLTIYNCNSLSTLSLSSLSTMQLANIQYTNINSLDWNNNKSVKYAQIFSNNSLSAFTSTHSLTSLRGLDFQQNPAVKDLSLVGLSSLDTLIVQSNASLSSLPIGEGLPNLSSISWSSDNPNLSTYNFSNCPKLKSVELTSGHSICNLFLNNNPVMYRVYVDLTDSANLSSVSFIDDAALKEVYFNNGTYITDRKLQNISFSNTPSLKTINLYYTALTSLNFLQNSTADTLVIYDDQNFNNDIVTKVSLGINLTAITIAGCSNVSNLDKINWNNLTNIKFLSFQNCSLTGINYVLENLPNKNLVESIYFDSNPIGAGLTRNQTINGLLLSSYNKIRNISLSYTTCNYIDWDSVMLGLCANSNIGTYGDVVLNISNSTSFNRRRSRYTNAAYVALTARTAQSGYFFTIQALANNTPTGLLADIYRAKPFIGNTIYNPVLQYTATTNIIPEVKYFDTSVTTYLSVVSGPGILTSSNTLSALSSTGTVAVLLSTIKDNIDFNQNNGMFTGLFAPVSSYLFITLDKLNISNNIIFSGLNKIYTGNAISAVATVSGFPGLTPSLTYYSGSTPVTPVAAGVYTVSAVAFDNNVYGTATAVLTVIDTTTVYTLPSSATSSYIYSPKTVNSEKDVVVSFDYAFYGTEAQGTEGFSVIFSDFNTYATRVSGGGPGKALNYSNLSLLSTDGTSFDFVDFPGRNKGMLGVGFDATGNFALTSLNVDGYNNKIPNTIALRGRYLNGYNVLYRTESLSSTNFAKPISLYQQTTATPEFYSARVRLANLGKRIVVDLKPLTASKYNNYLDVNLVYPVTGIVNVALGYSSGTNKPTFKVKNFNLNCYTKEVTATPYDLFNCLVDGPGTLGGGGITFTTPYNYSFFYNCITPTGLPYTMNLFVDSNLIGSVLFDPSLSGANFGLVRNSPYKVFYSQFLSGSKYLP